MSGIKGYPNQKKVQIKTATGGDKQFNEFVTVQPTADGKNALDTAPKLAARIGALRTVEAGSTDQLVVLTTHGAVAGDFIRFQVGATFEYWELPIVEIIDANSFYIGTKLPSALAITDTFYLMRYTTQRADTSGAAISTPGPTTFILDTVETQVNKDTGTPANSRPLPVEILDPTAHTPVQFNSLVGSITETAPATDTASSGLNGRLQRIAQRITSLIALLPASIGQKAKAGSLAVTLASDEDLLPLVGAVTETAPATDTASSGLNGRLQRVAQRISSMIALLPTALGQGTMATSFQVVLPSDQSAIATKDPVNAAGNTVNTSLTATTASAANAPANTVGFILKSNSDNTNNIRWAIGSTASTTVGMVLEPGRDTGYIPCSANLSVCAIASGTNGFELVWILSA